MNVILLLLATLTEWEDVTVRAISQAHEDKSSCSHRYVETNKTDLNNVESRTVVTRTQGEG